MSEKKTPIMFKNPYKNIRPDILKISAYTKDYVTVFKNWQKIQNINYLSPDPRCTACTFLRADEKLSHIPMVWSEMLDTSVQCAAFFAGIYAYKRCDNPRLPELRVIQYPVGQPYTASCPEVGI